MTNTNNNLTSAREALLGAKEVHDREYIAEWHRKTGTSPIRIVGGAPGGEKIVYETEGNFFLCGFTWLKVKAVGTGKELVKAAQAIEAQDRSILHTYKGYPSGFTIHFGRIPNCPNKYEGNGDHLIEVYAHGKAIDFLTEKGYDVHLYQNLD